MAGFRCEWLRRHRVLRARKKVIRVSACGSSFSWLNVILEEDFLLDKTEVKIGNFDVLARKKHKRY